MTKRFYRLLLAFAAILLGSPAVAQGYLVDFNTQIETNSSSTGESNRDWKVATGWGHIVDGVEYNYYGSLRYCPYEWQATAGVDGTGAIYAGSQFAQGYYGDLEYMIDLLVSPPLEGVVTIQAKRFNANGSIGFFKVTKNGDNLVRGDQILPVGQTANGYQDLEEDWVTYTLPAQPAGTRVGIRLQQGWIDNFTAESADFTPQPALGLTLVSPTVSTEVAADENNNFTVNFEFAVKNTGDIDLTTASEGYTVELRKYNAGGNNQEDHTLLTTVNIPADLAVGESLAQPLKLTATLSASDYPAAATSGLSFRAYENVSGTYASTRTVTVIPYEPKFDLRQGYSALEDYATLSFGASQEPVSKEVIIRSLGGAPLVIESVDVPEGFSTTLAPKTIPALTNDTITITLDTTTSGHKEGAFVIHTNAGYKTLNLSGTVISANDFFVDFSASSLEGIMLESSGSGYYTYGWTAPYTSYNITNEKARGYATSSSTPGPFKLILPKLKFEEGDVLQFDAQKASSYNDANLTIYYSANRNEWTQLRRLAHDAERETDKLTTNETTYTLQNIPAGEWYIAFEITYESEVLLDNIIGGQPVTVNHDLVLNATVPEAGQVNKPFNARATVRNLIAAEEAGSYTARLYFDDEVQKEAEAVALPTGQDVNFSFAFTPHAAGTHQARIELAFADGETVASTPVSVTIEEEVYSAVKQIGAGDKNQTSTPLHGYYNKTKAENIYTAEELAAEGITAGTKISQIAFLGYNTQRDQDYPAKVWIAEQESDEFASTTDGSGIVEGTPAFDGTVTLLKDGSSNNYAQILTIDLPAQYTYQGGNLVIATRFDGTTYLGSGAVAWAASTTEKTQAIYRYNDNSLDGDYSSTTIKPVVLLGIEAQAKTVSGKVTDKSNGAALANVTVTATSGEVVYSGKTNAEGNYEFAILQDGLEYQLSTDAEGYFPVNKTVSVKQESQVVNLELVPARGVFIDEAVIAETGMVNFPVSATVKASNYTENDFAAGAYTAKFFVDGEAVSQAEAVELKAGETKEFQFSYTPHAEGTFAAYVEFVQGENVTTSDETEIIIGEELVGGDLQIGEATADRTYYSPVNLYYNNSVADIVYTPEMLTAFGVQPGNQITSIKLTAQSESPKTFTAVMSAWVGSINYDAETFVPGAGFDDMQQVKADEQLPLELTGASSTSPIVWDITFDLTTPIVFDGTNSVRLMVDKFADNYVGYTYFNLDKNYTTAWVQYQDGADKREQLWTNLSSSSGSYHSVPVATFSVAGGVTVSGTVKNENGELLADATVEARSGEVLYTSTTDAQGNYLLDIKQAALDYTVTAAADGYDKTVKTINLNNEDKTLDFVLFYRTMSDEEAKALLTITPAEGSKVESLQTFRLTLNDGTGIQNIDGEDNIATLTNTTTGVVTEMGISTAGAEALLYTRSNEPVTEIGNYTLTIPAGTLQLTSDYSKFPELNYTFIIEPDPMFATGKYYLQNVASSKFWGAANDWGTRASLLDHPEFVTLNVVDAATNVYTLESQVSNGGTNYYFGGDYMDGQPVNLTIAQLENGNYTISQDGNFFGYDGSSSILGKNLDAASNEAQWQIFNEEQMLATLSTATQAQPADATFLILDPRFGRNNRNVGAWVVSDDCTNKNLTGGNSNKHSAESYHSTFTISQQVDAPNGVYALTAQGFYRQDGSDNENLAQFFANDETALVPLKTGTENSMADAAVSFENGLYKIAPIYVTVTDGKLNVGIKNEQNPNLWVIWDNFELAYYGADADINALKFGALLDQLAALRAEAERLNGTVEVESVKTALANALAATTSVDQTQEAIDAALQTLTAAVEAGQASEKAKNILPKMKQLTESTNVYTAEALDSYYTQWQTKYEAGTLTKVEADALQDPFLVTGWHASVTVDNFLLSAWDTNPDFVDAPYYINTWSVEGETDGSDFKVPFFEYWTGDDQSLGEKTLTATLANQPKGIYTVEALVRVRVKNGSADAPYGITLQVADGSPVSVTTGSNVGGSQFYLDRFTATATLAEDGDLKIQFQVAQDNNISWLSFKDVKYSFEKLTVYKNFAENTVFIPTEEAVAAAVNEGWMEHGGTFTNNKTLTINPETDEEEQTKNAPGIGLKKGNSAKSFVTYVTGLEAVWAYGSSTGSAERTLIVTAQPVNSTTGAVSEQKTTNSTTAVVKLNLSRLLDYKVEFTSVNEEGAGADMVLHAVKFITNLDAVVGISDIEREKLNVQPSLYNLNGQKVENTRKGIYILNGKKVVLK